VRGQKTKSNFSSMKKRDDKRITAKSDKCHRSNVESEEVIIYSLYRGENKEKQKFRRLT